MIVVFVIDTSASMLQRTALGTTYLDVARSAVETFLKLRGRHNDRYFLITYAEGLSAVKVAWNQTFQAFMEAIGKLRAADLSCPGGALHTTFDLLNLFRVGSGIDNYGQGRNPWFIEPATIVMITDGSLHTDMTETRESLSLPKSSCPGGDLTQEPFRWDQRLFTVLLRMPGTAGGVGPPLIRENPLGAMSDVTGGKSFVVTSPKAMQQSLESINSKIRVGVVASFKPLPLGTKAAPVADVLPFCPHRMIFVKPNSKSQLVGHWPIPEAFWPGSHEQLPPRKAHPLIEYSQKEVEPQVVEGLPFDKYELEPCKLTQKILSMKRTNVCWQVFMRHSHKDEAIGRPFGYLKPATTGNVLNLIVMPYDYPTLVPLLSDFIKVHKMQPPKAWHADFERYLASIPGYYIAPLKSALKRCLGPLTAHLVPDLMDLKSPYTMALRDLKTQAKAEADRAMGIITSNRQKLPPMPKDSDREGTPPPGSSPDAPSSPPKTFGAAAAAAPASHRDLRRMLRDGSVGATASSLGLFGKVPEDQQGVPMAAKAISSTFADPLSLPHDKLLFELKKLREALYNGKSSLEREEVKHSIPIARMGDYMEALRSREVLRDPSPEPAQPPNFGNPFKLPARMRIDETDDLMTDKAGGGQSPGSSGSRRKRRRIGSDSGGRGQPSPGARTPPLRPGGGLQRRGGSFTLGGGAVPGKRVTKLSPELATIKSACTKEIRKMGKQHPDLTAELARMTGDVAMRRSVVQDLLEEASRLKRLHLVAELERTLAAIK